MVARRRARVDPGLAEAELLAGLKDDLAAAMAAMQRGAAEEAADLIKRRHALAVALDDAEENWRQGTGLEGPELLAEHLLGLQEAAELAGMPRVVEASEDLSLLIAAGRDEEAATALARAAAPVRAALAQDDDEQEGEG